MKSRIPFDLNIPVLYVNPPINRNPGLIEEVSLAGGLGIIDHATAGPANFSVSPEIPHGVRIPLQEALRWGLVHDAKMIVIPYEDAEEVCRIDPAELRKSGIPVLVEVGNAKQAIGAERVGAAGLIARGNEGPGWVSQTNGLVLVQEILAHCNLPVFLQGGVGLHTASGAISAGAAGVVLDVHLLLAEGSGIETLLKDFIGSLSIPATVTLGECMARPLRVYSRVGTRIVREFKKIEDSLSPGEWPSYLSQLSKALGNPCSTPDSDNSLLPLSEDIIIEKDTVSKFGSARAIVNEFGRKMAGLTGAWPFQEGSNLCGLHGTRLPIVQGPMAHVSDNPDFLAAVADAGALPFLAMGNMPAPIARAALADAAQKTGGKFGVGLIGLEVNRECYEAHLEIIKENPPGFAILAAGNPDLAMRIEEAGTLCYLHCPSPAILSDALTSGLRHFVFEGCESGGHIGLLGSLSLWSANLKVIESALNNGLDLQEVSVLFAGGIASGWGSAFVAGMVSDLTSMGLNVGLQMGTAYLASDEAVNCCAITPLYRKLTLESDSTMVIGRTVNTRARAADSPMAAKLIEGEWERLRAGLSLRERKALYEKDNLGALRLASKGCSIDPETATSDCPIFCELASEEQLERGLYLMGQAVCLLDKQNSIEKLHSEIIYEGLRIFQNSQVRKETVLPPDAKTREDEPTIEVEHERDPIAVVGIGLRFPGSHSPDTFWEQIINGRSGIGPVPEDRWGGIHYYFDPDPCVPDKSYTKIGGFIRNFEFDPLKYRIPPSVAKKMDRTQQLAVACTADALLDAGLAPDQLKGKRGGVILGNSMGGESTDKYAERVGLPRVVNCLEKAISFLHLDTQAKDAILGEFRSQYLSELPDITEDSLPGELSNVISGRVANVFNLEGPNFTVDAACASSMAAVMNAVAALRDGAIDYVVTGGVDAAMTPSSFVKFCKIGALSADGSRPFDASADGFVMGEGAGIMILKKLSDALRDGDKIYGTVLEIGSSSDGKGKGITAPNAAGQERAVSKCYGASGISASSIGLIEAHGTSTAVGDKTELSVLDSFFRKAGIPKSSIGIGSVKSQIGHLKAAAGAAGMIKAILSLHHRTLPPTINIRRPNPCIDWESSPLSLLTEARFWPRSNGFPRRAGVSAFGFGGTNFHIVLQEYSPSLRLVSRRKKAVSRVEFSPPHWPLPPELTIQGDPWVLGGTDPSDLAEKIQKILKELNPSNSAHIASINRKDAARHNIRCGFAAHDADGAAKKLTLILEGMTDDSKLAFFPARGIHLSQGRPKKAVTGAAFLFPGQGSQYPFMLRDLAQRFPIVAKTFTEADEILVDLGLPSITSKLFPDLVQLKESSNGKANPLKDTQILQPLILTANTAIFRLLCLMGVRPVAVAGHSLGEYAACVAAGVFSFKDALVAVSIRGREMARVSIADPGLMMSIPADARIVEDVLAQVDGYVVAANKNSPKQTVISGETAAVRKAGELFHARGLEGILIPVSAAFHSGVVAPAREPFMKSLEKLTVNPPSLPVLSNVTGEFYPIGPSAPARIRDLLGKQFAAPVEWVKSLRRLHSEGIRIFLECGPKRVLTNFTIDTLANDVLAMPTNHPKKGGVLQLMETLAALVVEGVQVDFDAAENMPENSEPARHSRRSTLTIVNDNKLLDTEMPDLTTERSPEILQGLLDDEIRVIASKKEFGRFLDMQGEPIRGLIKSGFKSFVDNVVPLQKTARQVKSEGIDFKPIVVSGISAGLPNDVRFPFDRQSLDDLIIGANFIKKVPEQSRRNMLEKNVERVFKGPSGEAELQVVDNISGVIKLAGFFNQDEIIEEYGLDERIVAAMDVTTRLAVAAGIEALRDAGIPLIRLNRTTSTGHELPDSWSLPPALRKETGVIFASAFPGMASLVDEVTQEAASRYGSGAKKRLIDFYTGLVDRIRDDREREGITRWFTEEFGRLGAAADTNDLYTFNRNFLLRVMCMAHGQLAQIIKAQGPNTHVDAACAGTTQAMLLARDWIRTGQANRVIVVAADDVAGKTLLPWIGSGFLAMGAATTNGNVSEAALPFDDRRHGLILGSAAVGLVLEKADLVQKRGMVSIASIEAGIVANSGFHGTRLDVEHISFVMETMIAKWESQTGLSRDDLAREAFFMSHETYSPKRGGSSSAEIKALRKTFGDKAAEIPIANTKGFTGHTMGVGVEDVVALRCLQKKLLPPIPNLMQPDPEFADMNLSTGGACNANYAIRLAAGFGSQIVMALYKITGREENRISDLFSHRNWLKEITGYTDPVVSVEQRTLRVSQRQEAEVIEKEDLQQEHSLSKAANMARLGHSDQAAGSEEVRAVLLALLSEKTGYPADMLDTDLDLEADLGIDTVKQAEFISEVRATFNIPRIDGLKIADFPTISHIIGFVLEKGAKNNQPVEKHVEDKPFGESVSEEENIRVYETRLVSIPAPEKIDLVDVDEVIIAGGSLDLSAELENRLTAIGIENIRIIDDLALLSVSPEGRTGIINLLPLSSSQDSPRKTFQLYLSLAAVLEEGPAFLVTAVSEDGAYGFEAPAPNSHEAGAVTGATKAFSREYPRTVVRMLDLHPELGPTEMANIIARSLSENFPLETGVGRGSELCGVRLIQTADNVDNKGLNSGEVILATGGARGITAACLLHLAERQSLTLVIFGRTALSKRSEQLSRFRPQQWEEEKSRIVDRMKRQGISPTPVMVEKELDRLHGEAEVFQNISNFRALGSEVIYRSLDICDWDAVDRAVQEAARLCGRVDVVIHGAGIDVSRSLRTKTLEQIENVVSVKINGMRHLLDSLERHEMIPTRIIGFGSVSGRFGNMAQLDYSAANDALAHLLRRADRHMDAKVSIIDWAPWSEIGMAVRGSVQKTLEAIGIDFIPPKRGAEILAGELGRFSSACEVLAAGRLGPFTADAFHVPGTCSDGGGDLETLTCAGQSCRVTSLLPGEYLKAKILIDPSHPLLDHHRIDRAAVLPGVGGIEIMRGLAAFLDPRTARASFERVRFHSPLKIFKNEPIEAEVEVIRVSGSHSGPVSYRGTISSWFVNNDGHKVGALRLHHECIMVVAPDESLNVPDQDLWYESIFIPETDIYSVFFHGPAFRFLDHVFIEGNGKGIRFRYRDSLQRETMFSDFIPAGIEAAFQAAAAFGMESRGIMALPVGIDQVTVHSNDRVPYGGELVLLPDTPHENVNEKTTMKFEGVVTDHDGKPIVTLKGIRMVELEHSEGFPSRIHETFLSVDEIVKDLETSSGELLIDTLDEEELREHSSKATQKRASEWITGRVALKKSVQRSLAVRCGNTPLGKSIRITQDELGKPSAELSDRPGFSVGEVSLSHSNGLVVAIATAPGSFEGVGIDIEKTEARSEAWVRDYFTDEEIFAASRDEDRWAQLTRMWCLKEAVLKAFGSGLRFDLRDICVADLDDYGRARLEFRNGAAAHFNENGKRAIEARVEEREGLIIARVLIRK